MATIPIARRAAPWLLTLALAAPVPAQKLLESLNEGNTTGFLMTGPRWFAFQRTYTAPVTLTAVEFLLINWNAPFVTQDVGVWDEDPVTAAPRTLLGSGSFTAPQDVPGYYGARLVPPVALPAAGRYFIAIRMLNAIAALPFGGSTRTPYWAGSGTPPWTGPITYLGVSFRVYEGTHPGRAAAFGAGYPGAGGLVPVLDGVGWPNTTNPYALRLTQAALNVPCLFLLGARTSLSAPPLMLYATPLVVLPARTLSAGTGRGYGFAELALRIPADPALAGGMLASQALVFDPGALLGLCHTAGVEVLIGN